MPEEKKESFTFSDKIKNSKPAGSKSFAKPSSKIGRDGKPKQTLFERTRRDAPFFIAALVALLLLPFLYKYSGQSSEDTALLTPGSEESMFDPERYGFDTAMNVDDPDNQIAQLSGRSSLDLIKGWGNKEEDYGRDDMDFDASASGAYDAEGEYSANRSSSTNIDEEENITNIYKRRARQGTRAAFRRTQIGKLDPASMRRPGGNRLGIGNWGGSIKEAAKRVGPSGPRSAPKPVSLQPLRAAGPARSSFGGGAGVAARKGLDNMGKANAIEALRDSYVKPVDPVRAGGIDLFSDGRSGGSGKLDHNIHIGKGETPWWWDMMKTRMQKEWEARFERKWDWIKWADKLAQNILKGLINCLVTGDSDGDPDNFLGISVGGGSSPECCGVSESKMKIRYPDQYEAAGKDLDKLCSAVKKQMPEYTSGCGFKGGIKTDIPLGPVASRLKCLGLSAGAYASGELGLNSTGGLDCATMPELYQVTPSGQARKWKHMYIYVVARNYFPESLKSKFPGFTVNGNHLLCAQTDRNHGGDSLDMTGKTSSGVAAVTTTKNEAQASILEQKAATKNVTSEQEGIREQVFEVDQENLYQSCVIYVQRGDTFDYEVFKNHMIDRFKELGKVREGGDKLSEQEAIEAFNQLDLMFVGSFISKYKLAYAAWGESGNQLKNMLPMVYWRFYDAYLRHKKITHKKDGSKDKVYKAKYRVEGVDTLYGPQCAFGNMAFECGSEDAATAKLHIKNASFKGGNGEKLSEKDVQVSAEFRYLDNSKTPVTQPMIKPVEGTDQMKVRGTTYDTQTLTYKFTRIYDSNTVKRTGEAVSLVETGENGKGGLVGEVIWTATRGGETVTKTCPLNLSGDGPSPIVDPKPCPKGPQTSKECCEEIYGKQDAANDYIWEGGVCKITPKQQVPPPSGQQVKQFTLFAPGIKCVPNGTTDRKARPEGSMTEQEMCKLFGRPLVGKYNTSGQSCKDLWGFKMDSAKATAFVNKVKEAYNKQNPNLPIKFDKTYPQDSEFIDALNIAQSVGITDVPVAAVCEMGRDFVRMSKDKHVGDRSIVSGSTGTKNEPLVFRNELGAFLAYIHDTSILYPDAYVRVNGQNHCDWRFQPYGMGDGGCAKNGGPKIGKGYAHNNYNGTKYGGKLAAFQNSLTSIMKQTPLRALAGGKDLPHNCGNCKAMNGNNYVKQYNSYSGFAGLLHEETPSINGQGIACEAFLGGGKDATMKVEDALKYIEGVCTAGLDYKPVGQGRKDYVQGQSPRTAGGHSSGDEITGQRI